MSAEDPSPQSRRQVLKRYVTPVLITIPVTPFQTLGSPPPPPGASASSRAIPWWEERELNGKGGKR